eukprot:11682929-Alexandrium_andersonii.AAC.1
MRSLRSLLHQAFFLSAGWSVKPLSSGPSATAKRSMPNVPMPSEPAKRRSPASTRTPCNEHDQEATCRRR